MCRTLKGSQGWRQLPTTDLRRNNGPTRDCAQPVPLKGAKCLPLPKSRDVCRTRRYDPTPIHNPSRPHLDHLLTLVDLIRKTALS